MSRSPTTKPAALQASPGDEPPVFLQLSATYAIQPGASLVALLDDFGILFKSGLAAIQTESDDFTDAQWAGCLALRQAGAVFAELDAQARRLIATAGQKGGAA